MRCQSISFQFNLGFLKRRSFASTFLRKPIEMKSPSPDLRAYSRFSREELNMELQKKILLFRGELIKKRRFQYRLPPIIFPTSGLKYYDYTLSDLCGHGAFVFLSISYLESDFFSLRV